MPAAVPAQSPPDRTGGRYALHRPLDGVDELTRRRVGNANPRGRFIRAEGLFRLREDLTAAGDLPFAVALTIVLADWEAQVALGTISGDAVSVYRSQLSGLARLLTRLNQPMVKDIDSNTVVVWCLLPDAAGLKPTLGTAKTRRAAARTFFETAYRLASLTPTPPRVSSFPARATVTSTLSTATRFVISNYSHRKESPTPARRARWRWSCPVRLAKNWPTSPSSTSTSRTVGSG